MLKMLKEKKKKHKKSRLELVFQKEIKRSIPKESHYLKIPDMPRFKKSRFISKKPYDWYCIYNGFTFCIENKVHRVTTAWELRRIKEHQVESLVEAEEAGKGNVFSFVFINIRYGLGKNRICYIAVIHILDFLKEIERCKRLERVSIPVAELEKYRKIDYYRKVVDKNNLLFWDMEYFFTRNRSFRSKFLLT
jgi:penicillin-binding protein-related factor A (putative recombinase)